ncbi:lysophospholipid acyltransferase family protein [Mahella australiensis]|uniref:1-acyl-sn-glycerol-3-phosphate acyltransferase n=1 Tax=Mahella australiensis (strain DSM 15567 / CIP 107919 / 50-1 BON) TaxID=697281 RepID=F3ZZM9_MAHA5|nr:lysophospholipid acyltransferase family protein [Mahella australiensis]AEE96855.1 1-acyl-sn-glycerol-3-phosphate acyltransferase [Mahella australiensis 50-1 BON]
MRVDWFYRICKFIIKPTLMLLYGLRIVNKENIPEKSGCIIYANHTSYLDPVVIGAMLDRPINFMAKEELFHIPVLSNIIKLWGAFPVKRNAADITAIRKALNLIKKGELFGIFPEGTRSKDGHIAMLQPGVALIALKANAPVIPVFIEPYKLFGRTNIYVGEPLDLSQYAKNNNDANKLEEISDIMYEALLRLKA